MLWMSKGRTDSAPFSRSSVQSSDFRFVRAAVHVDFHARDVRRILRSQKRHGAGHFLGLSKPLHRNLRDDVLREFIDGFLSAGRSFRKIGVTIGPGATALTRMPRPTSSAAAVLARERSAALVAEYALAPDGTLAVRHAGIQDDRRAVIQERQRLLNR